MSDISDFMNRVTIIKDGEHVALGDTTGFTHFLVNQNYANIEYYFDEQLLEFVEHSGEDIDSDQQTTILRNSETGQFYKLRYDYYSYRGIDISYMDALKTQSPF